MNSVINISKEFSKILHDRANKVGLSFEDFVVNHYVFPDIMPVIQETDGQYFVRMHGNKKQVSRDEYNLLRALNSCIRIIRAKKLPIEDRILKT